MGFGFLNDDDDEEDGKVKELKHSYTDTLKNQSWKSLKVGQAVQSVLNGAKGFITNLNDSYKLVEIEWDNGNHSRAGHYDLKKVILIPVV